MGTWGIGLYYNDTTLDVRDTYMQFLKQQLSDEEAYRKTCEEYEELIGTDEEPLFWYALADTQWNVGRLLPQVKDTALSLIQENGGVFIFESNSAILRWKNKLQKLKEKLETPMPPKKKFAKPVEFIRNPWNLGDVYAYEFHTQKAAENGLIGKYILIQKVGDVEHFEDMVFSVIQVFDRVFDFIPDLDKLEQIRTLPLIYPPATHGTPDDIAKYIPSFEWYMKAIMIYDKKCHYPKKHLTFIGNLSVPQIEYAGNDFVNLDWAKDGMENWLIKWYLAWQNVTY